MGERFTPTGPAARIAANIEVLELLDDLQTAARRATPEEQAVLATWSGWGATPAIFDEADTDTAEARERVQALMSEEDWAAARRTVLNAHYTDPAVAGAMWSALTGLGFAGGRVLEPGCGSGNLIAYAPPGARMTGVERDPSTAAVARALYPDADIASGPFEQFAPADPFDAVIANVPFAKITPFDDRYNRGRHSLHNYFLVKSLALTRPGGVVIALTSHYTLDARNPAARRELAQLGDLVGALRLPTGAMRAAAGTDAILDLVVLRRRAPGDPPAGVSGWDRTVDVDVIDESSGEPASIALNRYFAEHPEHILGTPVVGRGMYRDGELRVRAGDLASVGTQVAAGLASIADASDLRYTPPAPPPAAPPRRAPRVGEVALRSDRRVPLREGSFVVSQSGVVYQHKDGVLRPGEVPKRSTDEVRALVALRDATVDLLDLEASDAPGADIEAGRRTLRDRYERYRHRWGPLNRVTWSRTGRIDPDTGEETLRRLPARLGGFRADPDWPTVSAVEVYDDDLNAATAAAILRQRTIHPPARRLGADTADEALAITLDECGRVDLERIAGLLGVEVDEARAELEPHVFVDPAGGALVPAEDYLAGDVRAKLAAASAAAGDDERFARNVTALQAVQPAQLDPKEIVVRPGAPWVDPGDVAAFVSEVLGADDPSVRHTESIGAWTVEIPTGERWTVAMTSQWGTERMSADRLFEACFDQRLVRITDGVDGRRILNVDATTAAREKQEQLAERFSAWVWEDLPTARPSPTAADGPTRSYSTPGHRQRKWLRRAGTHGPVFDLTDRFGPRNLGHPFSYSPNQSTLPTTSGWMPLD